MAAPAALAVSPRCKALAEFLGSLGEPEWRLKQIMHGIYKCHHRKWHNIDGLPNGLKWRLKDRFGKYISNWASSQMQEGDAAQKVLLRSFRDDARVEAVSLQFKSHRSLCISSQVGCAFQCAFCATGKIGLKRQLDADEIADQAMHFLQQGQKVDSVSLMGMGEPLGNPRVFDALRVLTSPDLMGLSTRRMNVSTVGVIPGILKLTEEFPQVNLAFSLHSPFTEERNRLVPLNRMFPMVEVFDVLDRRIRQTGRRVWICYLMLQGQNDTLDHARALVHLLKERPSETRYLYHVNLLPYNVGRAVPDHFCRAEVNNVEAFQKVLQENRISSSFRNSFGHGIDAACG
eukprot:CAMPEP_0113823572 /NCGR_PEP_ID=MMETSP0328-20130328/2809_1 /TAXON_ID=39455 /ORGANISM="Alexandrium minutum" /LENGTH=344 /DNA_ID=CAMNT_0000791511 /DNA_START=22 /DNA_END=1053 /DNA_ORIENTATION=- /assembly_acc=CAM_ASM_000350